MSRAAPVPGWWSDRTVPDLSRVLTPHLGIDPAEFAGWLGPLLAEYRGEAHIRESLPTRAKEAAFAAEWIEAIDHLAALNKGLPNRIEAFVAYEALRADLNWYEFNSKLRGDLEMLRILARKAHAATTGAPGTAGRKPSRARDVLLAAIVGRLRAEGLTAELARALSRDVLLACGVPAPADVKRAAKKGQK